MIRVGLLGFALSLFSGVTSAYAQSKADTNREVLRTYARVYIDQRNFDGIESMIVPYMAQDSGDPVLWNFLGLAQMELSHFPQACQAFEKAKALMDKQMNQDDAEADRDYIRYNLADCYNREGKDREAILVLNHLVSEDGNLAGAARSAIDLMQIGSIRAGHSIPPLNQQKKGHFLVSGAIASGFDTNVLLVEEAVINSIPISDRGSAFVTPAVQVGYQGIAFNNEFEARYLAAFNDYLSTNAQSFNSLYQRADFMIGSGPIRWGVFGDALFLNRNPFQLYNWDAGISWNHTRNIDATHSWTYEAPVRFQKYVLDSNVTEDNDRTGADLTLKATYRALRGDGSGSFTAQFALDNQYTKGKNYRLSGLTIPLYYTVGLPFLRSARLINTLTGEVSGQYYWQSDLSRKDFSGRVGTGLIWKISNGWSSNLDYFYFRNFSNVESARYTKNVVSILVSHDFL
jgi:tetratricopeptide (TPR) repeat protein